MKEPRLPEAIMAELEGATWQWVCGSKHWKLLVNGQMVGIWPRGSSAKQDTDRRPLQNLVAQIRRFKRQVA